MPTYEYQCILCSYRFDLFQSITEGPVLECPKCHGKVERLISAGAGFLFKGKGFYITDYRSEEYRRQKKAEKENKETKK